MNDKMNKKYGFFTSMTMIVGIVIGSGIFFKIDDILISTNKNVTIGAIALIVGAIGIIFGGLSLSTLAQLDDKVGGIITYGEIAVNKFFAFLIGFFQMVCYFPALIAIIAFVCANYTLLLFPNLPFNIWIITLFYLFMIFAINFFSAKCAGLLQNLATIIKIIPLITIGVCGILFGTESALSTSDISLPLIIASSNAIVAVAFSYDGWTIAPSICHEIKNAKRNLPLALSISPIIIMIIYLLYFIGMNALLGPDKIISLGDAHIYYVANMFFGTFGSKLIMITIIISVLGTLDGLTMGAIRIPYALAIRQELPKSNIISTISNKYKMPTIATIIAFLFTLLWLFIHYLSTIIPSLSHLDISGIPIVIMYLFYTIIFIRIISLYKKHITSSFVRSVICSILACIGSFIVIYGALSSTMGLTYITISFIILLIGAIIYTLNKNNETKK